jgi:methionine-rich copper-binding protein CopC
MSRNIIGALASTLVLFTSSAAFAHAHITASTIANGGRVASAPASFSVTFSGPVRLATVTLTNATGQQVPLSYRGPATPSATFAVPLPRLAAGTYTMTFRSMGADGHVMAPQTTFTIGGQVARAAPPFPAKGGMDHSKMGGMAGMNHSGSSMTVITSIADGATLTTPPSSMRVTFPHAMRLTSARLSVASGETIPVRLSNAGAATTTADILFPRLDADSYTLTWGADAGDHTMGGTVRFRVR